MNQKSVGNNSTVVEDFRLWRFLDLTRYAISRSRELELAQFGLTPEQAYVLDILSVRGGSTTIGYIMDITLRQHHTISTLIARMAKRGLVEKRRSVKDKRSYDVIITPEGQALFEKVTRKSIELVFSTLSREDKRALGSLLQRLLIRAYEMSGTEFDFTKEPAPCSE
jgi:DNA-binding MarR family transcriptional regulator